MIVDHPAKFHNEKIPKKYPTVSKTVRTGMVRHLRILLICAFSHSMCVVNMNGLMPGPPPWRVSTWLKRPWQNSLTFAANSSLEKPSQNTELWPMYTTAYVLVLLKLNFQFTVAHLFSAYKCWKMSDATSHSHARVSCEAINTFVQR